MTIPSSHLPSKATLAQTPLSKVGMVLAQLRGKETTGLAQMTGFSVFMEIINVFTVRPIVGFRVTGDLSTFERMGKIAPTYHPSKPTPRHNQASRSNL